MQLSDAAAQIVDAGRWLDARGWAPATAGNYSIRLDSATIAVTVSGRHKGRLTADDVMVVDYDGVPLDGKRPSAETPLHTAMYRLDASLNAVVHTHSVASTVLGIACAQQATIDLAGYEQLKAFRGVTTHETSVSVPVLENTRDTNALARVVMATWAKQPCVGYVIRGHGLYTWGETMQNALHSIETLEFLFSCELERRKLGV